PGRPGQRAGAHLPARRHAADGHRRGRAFAGGWAAGAPRRGATALRAGVDRRGLQERAAAGPGQAARLRRPRGPGPPRAPRPAGGLLWANDVPDDPMDAGILWPGESPLPLVPATPRVSASLTGFPDGAALLAGGKDAMGKLVTPLELYEKGMFRALEDEFARV